MKNSLENGDNKWFIAILYEKSLNLKSQNNIISINLSQSSNCFLYFLKVKL